MTKTISNLMPGVFLLMCAACGVNSVYGGFTTTKINPQPMWNATYTDKLRQDLLLNYDKFARPAQPDQKITVFFGLTIRHIDINELKHTLTVHCWIRLNWNDIKLQWNASDYGGLTLLHFAEHEIWQPDIFLYNSATSVPLNYYSHTQFIAQPSGNILWVPSAQFTVLCTLNLRYWPFDTQKCQMTFGSWTYHGDWVDMENSENITEASLELLVTNTEWAITKTHIKRNSMYYKCCEEPYVSMDITMDLSRISPSYKAIVVTPAFVVMILTLLNFWLPPQSGEKIIVNSTTGIIICLFLLYFTQTLPAMGANTPLIVLFYASCLYLVSFSMIGSVVVISLSRTKHSSSLPWVIKQPLTGKLGQILGLGTYIGQSSMTPHRATAEEMRDHQVTDFDDINVEEHHIVRQCSSTGKPLQQDWVLLAAAVDRILFILYFFLFAILAFVYSL